jgi:hypothetical protein
MGLGVLIWMRVCEGRLKGWALKVETCLGPKKMAASAASAIWAPKSRIKAESLWNRYSNFLKFFIKLQHFKRLNQQFKGPT